ncbi:anaerobic dimethyl sulfoxide reductase subunit C [Proteus hauseri ATCC 700826]|uniref:Anaerobic dimethyl sulfoxide reductase subunit C n=1 Tax=Proteus hauseri ATCC 700826 TaxID=1354271 RepID=A0AAJ3LTH5_PROHU|nr:anaerobic dimethyl sulfoxide reductase subunit C [Proteus hauseri ATCC 700826]
MGGLGLLVSTLHMGYPWNAFYVLRHISSSWLSCEIIFAAIYLGAFMSLLPHINAEMDAC